MRSHTRSALACLFTWIVVACASNPPPADVRNAPPDAGVAVRPTPKRCDAWRPPAVTADAGETANEFGAAGRRAAPENANDSCATADSNLARATKEVLEGAGGAVTASVPWDRKRPPARLDRVGSRLALTATERSLLAKNGFVVLGRRSFPTYTWALHEVYQSELPLYVSADAILHAVFVSNDHLLAKIESDALAPAMARTLSALHCALPDAADAYPPEVLHDLDVYLTTARSLLDEKPVPSVLGTDDEVRPLVRAAFAASGIATVELFGRPRLVDWSAFQPRGHYTESLAPFFRAAMWLSRTEMNLVSRSSMSSSPAPTADPRETPREAMVAVALADLVARAHVEAEVDVLDRAWTLLAGRREDVSVRDMAKLRQKAGIGKIEVAAFPRLKAAIGSDFQRTARLHPMPEGSTVLPAIATLLGPRVTADTAAFRPLVNGETPGRYMVSAGDVAYVLGLDHGKVLLKDDLAKFPALAGNLERARATLKAAPDGGDLYGAWLAAVRGIAERPSGTTPSFMQTPAYDDLRIDSLVSGYGQVRHNYVLAAGQSYDEGGCEIPDGFVEPLPAVYAGIGAYATRGGALMKSLDPEDTTGATRYFAELGKVASVLERIARHELEGRALSEPEKRFLSMVVEMSPGSTGGPPTYTGWYFDIFRGRSEEALAAADFVADFHTSSHLGQVAYVGASAPKLGVFVVDSGGTPRVVVGPVASSYEVTSAVDRRLDDASAREAPGKRAPWSASYEAAPVAGPAFAANVLLPFEENVKRYRVVLRAKAALAGVTVELLDHHRRVVGSAVRSVPANGRIVLSLAASAPPEGLRIRMGDYSAEAFRSGPSDGVAIQEGVELTDKDWLQK